MEDATDTAVRPMGFLQRLTWLRVALIAGGGVVAALGFVDVLSGRPRGVFVAGLGLIALLAGVWSTGRSRPGHETGEEFRRKYLWQAILISTAFVAVSVYILVSGALAIGRGEVVAATLSLVVAAGGFYLGGRGLLGAYRRLQSNPPRTGGKPPAQ